ncbi:MAG: hypothetical protein M1134_04245 [Actinobacteria bacterium]|nr:hypothetical protein [Actinomycetota bacterium]
MPRRKVSRESRQSERPLAISGTHWRDDGTPKVRFTSRSAALATAQLRASEAGVDLGVYQCEFCNGWHMGRSTNR